jgi:hypothetical protein
MKKSTESTFSTLISPCLFKLAEKAAQKEGVSISDLIATHIPKPIPQKRSLKGYRKVSLTASKAKMEKVAKMEGTDVQGLIVRALASATFNTSLTPDEYREIAEAVA